MDVTNRRQLHALIDLDGTMFKGSTRIEGADELIHAMLEWHVPFLFVTNNSSRSPEQVADVLQSMGIPAKAEDVLTSAQAAAHYISSKFTGKSVYMIGELGLRSALAEAGVEWTDQPQDVWQKRIDVVVQGIDRQFSYEKLEAAACAIRGGAAFVATNPDYMLPSDKGFSPGAGTLMAAIQAASGTEPVLIGKPSSIIMKVALERLNCQAEETLVIGDNMMTDMLAGARAGCRTALVLTGVTTSNNLASYKEKSGVSPEIVCPHLHDMKKWLGIQLGR
ncbi:TIGR01457 family HAD-type hydrolase [Paenibacillus taiwanensis]|uniref:TIGR01457 family HAD-type hydrolase n=1 Tax=Paenibacillus taiwanensis TaxID=401638 RepID=UPI0003FAF6FF|nr:TIGR01457 family HAD-type hydrolase [Paenibacillus taiwanensis]